MVTVDSLLKDRYRVREKLAAGGMGTVYAATDEKLARPVALKVLADHLAGDDAFVERFKREARAVAGLAHPNIANVFDYGESDGCHFIVMELVEGHDLARILREEVRLPPERVIGIVTQICSALGHAHSAGIVHRDVKPANVIVGANDRVKVTDFGIARAAGDSKLTVTGSVLGTAHYISPEQALGSPLTPASDIYSLGIVTYELLTGAPPFTGESLMAVAMRHAREEVPAPSEANPAVPPELDEVVRRATEKDPAARFADTQQMLQALESVGMVATGSEEPTAPALPATAELRDTDQTVWPIPGDRWDPAALGRKVVMFFIALALIALALALWRVASSPDRAADRSAGSEGPRSEPDDVVNPTIPTDVIGADVDAAADRLSEEGILYTVTRLAGGQLEDFLEERDVAFDDADLGEVVGTDPAPGDVVKEGQTVTLFVSGGFEEDDEGDGPGRGKGKPPGHEKKEKEDD